MDELNLQMEESAAGGSTQELETTYDTESTVVIFEETPSTVQQVTGTASTQATGSADLKSKCWTHEATLLLIELYKSYQDSMKDPRIKKKDVWNRIASDMAVNGFHFHGDMCDKKWRNLKKSYFSVLESKSIQGSQSRRIWQYFDVLNDVFPKEASSADAATGTVVVATGGGGDGANGTLISGLSNSATRPSSSSSSKIGKTRSKIATVTAAASAIVAPVLNSGISHGTHAIPPSELELVLTDGALEDMSPIHALKVLLDRQERNEERRMGRMMDDLRKMHDENLEVMHERNVLLHRLIEQLSSGT